MIGYSWSPATLARPTVGGVRLPNGREVSTKRLASKLLPVREAAAPAEPDSRRPSPVPVCSPTSLCRPKLQKLPTSPAASGCETSELRLRRTSRPFIRLQPLSLVLFSGFTASRAISSVVERLLHTQEVAGSNPASRTRFSLRSTACSGNCPSSK